MATEKNYPIAKMGRPSLFTPEARQKILEAVSAGNYDYVAAESAGVTRQTFWGWMKRGKREKEGEYYDFFNEVTKAINGAEVKIVAGVVASGMGDPKSWQWWLERKCPERWGRDTYQIKQLEKEVLELKAQIEVVLGVKSGKKTKA